MQKNIDFMLILRNAWDVLKAHRRLCWLGLFIILGSGGGNFLRFRTDSGNEESGAISKTIVGFIQHHWMIVISIVIILILLFVALLVLRILAQAAIIKAAHNLPLFETTKISQLLGNSKEYFWRLFFIDILLGLGIFFVVLALSVPVIALFYLSSYILGFLMLLIAILIFVPIAIIFAYTIRYAYYYVVLGGMQLIKSIKAGYTLFFASFKNSILMGLIMFAVGMAFSIALLCLLLVLGLLFFAIGSILYMSLGVAACVSWAILAGIALLAAMLAASAIFQTFIQIVWLMFFKEISAQRDTETEPAKELAVESIPDPEAA